ncbi:MAG: hypothetical protein QXP80_00110 [Zestosphaera sp.]
MNHVIHMTGSSRTVCVAGHIGVGHVHSHSGLIQDDSLGYASAVALLRKFFDFNVSVRKVTIHSLRTVCVETEDGGFGCASPRRGLTTFETEMLRSLEGADASLPHLATLRVFGRMYGNGCLEAPVAVEYSLAEAALDTLARRIPGFILKKDGVTDDIVGGVEVNLEGGTFSVLLTVNGSRSGVGPVEDLEGNVPLGVKGEVMKALGVLATPTVVLESKAFIPALAGRVIWTSLLLRYNKEYDNVVVAEAIRNALEERNANYIEVDNAYPRFSRGLESVKHTLVESLKGEALKLESSKGALEKSTTIANLAKLICEDFGGVVFMSEDLSEVVGFSGVVPGTSAVASIAVGNAYIQSNGIPYATYDDAMLLANIALEATKKLHNNYEKAMEVLRSRYRAPTGSA